MRIVFFYTILISILFVNPWVQAGQESHGMDEVLSSFEQGASDLLGFSVPDQLSLPGIMSEQIQFSLPMFPIYEHQKYAGIMIPKEFICPGYEVQDGERVVSMGSMGLSKVSRAFEQVRALGLSPVFYNGNVYGVKARPDGVMTFGHESSWGIHIDLGSSFSRNSLDFVERSGFSLDPTQGFQNLILKTQAFFYTKSPFETLREISDVMPYVRMSMYHHAFKSRESELENLIPTTLSKDLVLDIPQREDRLMIAVDPKDYNSSLRSAIYKMQDPKEIEIEIGLNQELTSVIQSQLVVNHKNYQDQIEKLCDHISLAMHVPDQIHPRCRILASFTPNAFAFPGGDIFVTAGLIGVLDNVGALSFVLAHEISHVMGRHSRYLLNSAKFSDFILLTLGWAGEVYTWGGGFGDFNFGHKISNMFGASLASNTALNGAYFSILAALFSYNRTQEEEADDMGHEAALASGCSHAAMVKGWENFLTHIETYYPLREDLMSIIFSTHPKGEDRLEELKKNYPRSVFLSNKYFENGVPLITDLDYVKMHLYFKNHMKPYLTYLMEKKKQDAHTSKSYSSSSSIYDDLFMPTNVCVLHALAGVRSQGFWDGVRNVFSW